MSREIRCNLRMLNEYTTEVYYGLQKLEIWATPLTRNILPATMSI